MTLVDRLKAATGSLHVSEANDLAYEAGFDGESYSLMVEALRGGIKALGAALALVERLLPEYDWEVGRYDGETYFVTIWECGLKIETSKHGQGATPALALLIALFTAKQGKDTTHADKCENIFVFGSNLAGRHGKGAAKFALENHGAIYGRGIGLQGNSYAIPTKDSHLKPYPLESINLCVQQFIRFAIDNPQMTFQLTPIGCGLAGYKPSQIAPMFKNAPDNVIMPEEFKL